MAAYQVVMVLAVTHSVARVTIRQPNLAEESHLDQQTERAENGGSPHLRCGASQVFCGEMVAEIRYRAHQAAPWTRDGRPLERNARSKSSAAIVGSVA